LSDEVTYYQAPQDEGNEQEKEKETGNEEAKSTFTASAEKHSRFWPVTPNPNDYDHKAVNNCARACRETASCFQYLWDGGSCKLSTKFFTLGGMKLVEEERRWVSGWNLERVREFQSGNGECGSGLWEYDE
jgi:hypothetical protein